MTITVKSCKRIIFLRGKKEEETKKHDVYNKEAYHITKLCIYIVAGTSQIIVIPGNKKLRSNSNMILSTNDFSNTIFCFIVLLHILYGPSCFRLLVCIGLCQERQQVCYLAGINGLGSTTRIFGI